MIKTENDFRKSVLEFLSEKKLKKSDDSFVCTEELRKFVSYLRFRYRQTRKDATIKNIVNKYKNHALVELYNLKYNNKISKEEYHKLKEYITDFEEEIKINPRYSECEPNVQYVDFENFIVYCYNYIKNLKIVTVDCGVRCFIDCCSIKIYFDNCYGEYLEDIDDIYEFINKHSINSIKLHSNIRNSQDVNVDKDDFNHFKIESNKLIIVLVDGYKKEFEFK